MAALGHQPTQCIKLCTIPHPHTCLGPDEAHTVHKLRTTTIILEEDGQPGDGSTVQIEEMGSYQYATQQSMSYQIQGSDDVDSEAESARNKSTARGISIMSVSEDDNNGLVSREISVEERDIAMTEGNAKIRMTQMKKETKETVVMEGNGIEKDLDDVWASKEDDDVPKKVKKAVVEDDDDFWGNQEDKTSKAKSEDTADLEHKAKLSKKLIQSKEDEDDFWGKQEESVPTQKPTNGSGAEEEAKLSKKLNKAVEDDDDFWGKQEKDVPTEKSKNGPSLEEEAKLRKKLNKAVEDDDEFWGKQEENVPTEKSRNGTGLEDEAKLSEKAQEDEDDFWGNYKAKKTSVLKKLEETEQSFWGSDEDGKSAQVDENKKDKSRLIGKTQEEDNDFWAESDGKNDIQVKKNVRSTMEVEDQKTTQTTESTYEMKQKSVVDNEWGTGEQEVTIKKKVTSSTTYEEYEQKPEEDDIWSSGSAEAKMTMSKTRTISSVETTKEQSEEGQAIDNVWGNSDTYEIARKFKPKTDIEEEPQETDAGETPRKFTSKTAKEDSDSDDFWGKEDKTETVSKAREQEKASVEVSGKAAEEDDIWGNGDEDWSRRKPKVEVEEDAQVSKVLDRTKSVSDTDGAAEDKDAKKKSFASKYDAEPGISPYSVHQCFTFSTFRLHSSTNTTFTSVSLHG